MLLSLAERAIRLARRDLYWDILALLAFPLLLLLVNSSWFVVAPSAWIDTYVYTGYMLDLRHHIQEFGPTYYGSRLPWLLFGSAAHSVASFEVANLFLRLTLFYGGTFALYVTIRCVWKDRLIATLVAVLLGSNVYFLLAITWDYVDGAGIVLLLAILACLTLAQQNQHRTLVLIAAGALTITAISVQIFLIALMPPLAAWYLLLGREISVRRVIKDVMSVLFGVMAGFICYALMSLHLGGDFNYLQPQIDAARTLDASPYKTSGYGWLDRALWLAVPATAILTASSLLLVLGVPYLKTRHQKFLSGDKGTVFVVTVPLLLAVASFAYFQIRGGAQLQYQYYADYLLPFSFLAFGGPLVLSFGRLPSRWRPWTATVIGAIVSIPLLSTDLLASFWFLGARVSDGYLYLIFGAAVFLVAGARLHMALLGIFAVALLSLLNIGIPDGSSLYFAGDDTVKARAYLIPQTYEYLARYRDTGQLRYWYDFSESSGAVYRGVASMDLWLYRLVSEDFPNRTDPYTLTQSPLRPGEAVAILSGREDALELARAQAEAINVSLDLLGEKEVRRGNEAFRVLVVRAMPGGLEPRLRVPLTGFVSANGAAVNAQQEGLVTVETLPKRWYYAAMLALPLESSELNAGPAYIRVRGEVRGAPVGIGVVERTQQVFLDRVPVKSTRQADVFLKVEHLEDAAFLVIQTWSKESASSVSINDVTIYVPRATPSDNQDP